MSEHIGTPTSRVDGRAKVTGAAKYAAEFNADGLVHGCVVASTIAKGRITRIDASEALRVAGRDRRVSRTRTGRAWRGSTAATRTTSRRPARRSARSTTTRSRSAASRSRWCVAEELEIARYAATLVRVEYNARGARDGPAALERDAKRSTQRAEPKPRGDAEKAFAAAAGAARCRVLDPVEHHNPMEMYATTVIVGRRRQAHVYDKTQGVQNVAATTSRSVFGFRSGRRARALAVRRRRVRLGPAPAVPGRARGAGGAIALKRSVRVVLTRQQMFSLGYRPATIQRVALGANAERHARRDRSTRRSSSTSQYEDFQRNVVNWSGALYNCAEREVSSTSSRGSTCRRRATCARRAARLRRLCARMRDGRARREARARPARAAAAQLRRPRPERGHAVHQQGAARVLRAGRGAFGWDKRNPAPRSMRDGSELVGWGMATGVWEAMQMKTAVRIVLTADGQPRSRARPPTSAPAPTRS